MLDARAKRIAMNEARFRDINERLEQDLKRLPVDGHPVEFVCECGSDECTAPVRLALDEYERVRQDPLHFAVIPGHQIGDVETALVETDRYVVVRKHAEAAQVVEPLDVRPH